MILTHIGGPTVMIETDGWRLLTDPTFDPGGGHYAFGWGTSSDKITGPAVAAQDLPPIDAVLLSHDQHGDNLDTAGRALLDRVPTVVTTVAGARRLRHPDVRGIAAGGSTVLRAPGRPSISITATPARHGPPLTSPLVGQVIGFALRRDPAPEVFLWITGDTVPFGPLRRAARQMDIDVAILHAGGVRFPITGPLRFTMTGREVMHLIEESEPRIAIPMHYEGWAHFRDGQDDLERALADAPASVAERVRWLPLGEPVDIA